MEGLERYFEYGDENEGVKHRGTYFKFSVERAIDIFYYFEYWDEGIIVDDRR